MGRHDEEYKCTINTKNGRKSDFKVNIADLFDTKGVYYKENFYVHVDKTINNLINKKQN